VDSEFEMRCVENQGTLKDLLLVAFVELRKATITFDVSVRLSVRRYVRMELGAHETDFHEI